MAAQDGSVGTEARRDDLRRRLYRADATDADLRRYLDELDTAPADEPPAGAADRTTSRALPRRAALAVGLGLAAAGALAVVTQQGAPTVRAARATSSQAAEADVRSVREGQVLTADGTAAEASSILTSIRGTPVLGQLVEGRGSAFVPVDAPPGPVEGGRAMVVLASGGTSPVAWRALLVVTRNDWTSSPIVMARGLAGRASGGSFPTTFVYPERPPSQIAIAAPEGVRWTLLVAAANGLR